MVPKVFHTSRNWANNCALTDPFSSCVCRKRQKICHFQMNSLHSHTCARGNLSISAKLLKVVALRLHSICNLWILAKASERCGHLRVTCRAGPNQSALAAFLHAAELSRDRLSHQGTFEGTEREREQQRQDV